MIKANARLSIAVLPLEKIVIREFQQRYPEKLTTYIQLLSDNPEDYAGLLSVEPLGDDRHEFFVLLDGHHRFAASIMTGRKDALCLIIEEPQELEELVCDGMGGFMQKKSESV